MIAQASLNITAIPWHK